MTRSPATMVTAPAVTRFPSLATRLRSGIAKTPGRIGLLFAVVTIASAISCIATVWIAGELRQSVQTIGSDAAPSVILAARIRATLSAMDAEALDDALLDNGQAVGTSAAFHADFAALTNALIEAARNVTYGEAEAGPIREAQIFLGRYLESLGEIRSLDARDAWLARQRVKWSSRLLRDFVMPNAEALQAANQRELDYSYQGVMASALPYAAIVASITAAAIVAMVLSQVFLARRTRRLLNVPIGLATVVALLWLVWLGVSVIDASADLRSAKLDAYDSVQAMYEAKALAASMRADRALWLLDPDTRPIADANFEATRRRLTTVSQSDAATFERLRRAVELERAGKPDEARAISPGIFGLLGGELANITFGAEEREPATQAVFALVHVLDVDTMIRDAEAARRHIDAVRLTIGADPDGSVAAFRRLDQALDEAIAVNQRHFDQSIARARGSATRLAWVGVTAFVAILVLSGVGFWLRYREYR